MFMLTDSRESRWLPTLLATRHRTALVNAALGFDSWVVMRHGGSPNLNAEASETASNSTGNHRLGCYFCNDVVAPANSAGGRAMDEQCTVVRPGLARIAAAHAVEMAAALSQHPAWIDTPDMQGAHGTGATQPALGAVPHMLRGCLTGFTQTHMTGHANICCSACSPDVQRVYERDGTAFVMQAVQVCCHPAELVNVVCTAFMLNLAALSVHVQRSSLVQLMVMYRMMPFWRR